MRMGLQAKTFEAGTTMKKYIALLLFPVCLAALPCQALELEDLWNKYFPDQQEVAASATPTPGRLLGNKNNERRTAFVHPWKYRHNTYELHYEDPAMLAATVYGIALHVGDIDESLKVERFIGGVLGYHYSMQQVCAWLNAVANGDFPLPKLDEMQLALLLLQDEILVVKDGHFISSGKVNHVLGSAPGKKRTFSDNLRHERLHVFWDEDASFREQSLSRWNELSAEKQDAAKKELSRYASGNERQLIEEWAIHQAESSNMTIVSKEAP